MKKKSKRSTADLVLAINRRHPAGLTRAAGAPEPSPDVDENIRSLIKQINDAAPTFTGQIRAVAPEGEKAEGAEPEYELSFSSEEPYERWFGIEILGHDDAEVRMDWLNSGNAPLLNQHDHHQQVGVIKSAKLGGGRGTAVARFGRGKLAQEIRQDVDDEIRKNVSVGYRVYAMVLIEETDESYKYRVTDWEPYEVSIVAVPADQTVGTNRAAEQPKTTIQIKEETMDWKKLAREMGMNEDSSPEAILAEQKKRATAAGEKIAEEKFKSESARRDTLMEMARKHGLEKDVQTFIDEGKSALDFGDHIAAAYRKGHTPLKSAKDLSEGERADLSSFSMRKFILEGAEGNFTGLEKEMVEEGRKELKLVGVKSSGIYLPHMVAAQRSSTVATAANAGNLVETTRRGFVEVLMSKLWLAQMGVQMWDGLVGNIEVPRDNGIFTGEDQSETGALTAQDLDIDVFTLSPKRKGAAGKFTLQLLNQSSIAVDNFITQKCASGVALALNTDLLTGDGTGNNLLGLLNLTGANAVIGGTNGAALDWAKILEFETKINVADADIGTMGILTNNAVKGKLKGTQKVSGQSEMLWQDSPERAMGMVNGYNALATNLVPSDLTKGTAVGVCSAMIQGIFSSMIVGSWGGLDVVIQREKYAETGEIGVVVNGYYGSAYEHEECFSVMEDVLV